MPEFDPRALLDPPPFPADGYAGVADRLAALLCTRNDVLLIQGEAIVALEAAAKSVASKNIRALNVVTSPYGRLFGLWLREGGADVSDLAPEPGKPIAIEAFAAALSADPAINLVATVHAESATGILNPLSEIAELTRKSGALLIVDAVASFGGHPIDVDALGIDICVTGPQKSLGGSSATSIATISPRAWAAMRDQAAPSNSILSFTDLREQWLDTGRNVLPGMPSSLEFWSLQAALDRLEEEGLQNVVSRHAEAAQATRDAVRALGLQTWVDDAQASNLVTGVLLPSDAQLDTILRHPSVLAAGIQRGIGDFSGNLIRLNHTGQRARPDVVTVTVSALSEAIGRT